MYSILSLELARCGPDKGFAEDSARALSKFFDQLAAEFDTSKA